MKKLIAASAGGGIVILFSLLLVLLQGTPIEASEAAKEGAEGEPATSGTFSSCATPAPAWEAQCQQWEAGILAATVRLLLRERAPQAGGGYGAEIISIGHATVMAGRYLVTHNHFSLSFEKLNDGHLRALTVYGLDGTVIIQEAPLHTFTVVVAEPETLVLDFGTYGRHGALAYIGLESAPFGKGRQPSIQPGAEVAQVNWDGTRTYVEWVKVKTVTVKMGTAVAEIDNYVEQGASGGGIFYQGYHVGNNWLRGREKHGDTGQVLRQYTAAALNTAELLSLAARDAGGTSTAAGNAAPAETEMGATIQ